MFPDFTLILSISLARDLIISRVLLPIIYAWMRRKAKNGTNIPDFCVRLSRPGLEIFSFVLTRNFQIAICNKLKTRAKKLFALKSPVGHSCRLMTADLFAQISVRKRGKKIFTQKQVSKIEVKVNAVVCTGRHVFLASLLNSSRRAFPDGRQLGTRNCTPNQFVELDTETGTKKRKEESETWRTREDGSGRRMRSCRAVCYED